MKYDLIDEQTGAEAGLQDDAKQLANRAILAEYEARRVVMINEDNDPEVVADQIEDAQDRADETKKEAEAFQKASKLPKDEYLKVQRDAVRGQIIQLEGQHLAISRRTEIRRNAGIATADSDANLVQLEKSKAICVELLKELGTTIQAVKEEAKREAEGPNRAQRRAEEQARRTTKRTTAPKKAAAVKKAAAAK